MSRRRSRRSSVAQEPENHERWMASYMDMVTVLMCLFIVLYAMSTVDQGKFAALKDSLATGFGVEDIQRIDTAEGVVVPPELSGTTGLLADTTLEGMGPEELAKRAEAEHSELDALRKKIDAKLVETGHAGVAAYNIDARGLTVLLVSAETFFVPNSAELANEAEEIIDAISPILADSGKHIQVEGFADELRPIDPYPTNWELSASRATGVLRAMVEDGSVAPDHIASVGYGDARPLKGNEKRSLNRRVDIVVLSDQPESVRNLLAQVK
ncbi:OmpA/MotB family protein [Glutamicibacter ardleyensis]|uniref:Chemotaxis protein MotB n=1 Tax=Glutamicibacter ardleyensis TaxID=225894 RepID=A0ABQ2DTS7_9MICC|nr:flagellar motor protein MotB [Glutamicibacter ardleyensis]GGJ69483.1 chemotaxis protein MotB [Glutamicibacter ardleyensis]